MFVDRHAKSGTLLVGHNWQTLVKNWTYSEILVNKYLVGITLFCDSCKAKRTKPAFCNEAIFKSPDDYQYTCMLQQLKKNNR